MLEKLKEYAIVFGVIAALVGGYMLFNSWRDSHDAALKLQATLDAKNLIIDAAQKQMDVHAEADKQRDAQTATTLAAMQAAVQKVQTPQQIAAWLPQQFQTPQPVTIQVPAATPTNPTPDAVATIPQADLPILRDAVAGCQACNVKLTTANADYASLRDQYNLQGTKLKATETERDTAITAAKGGTFWQRTRKAAKWIIIGAAAGAVATCASGHCR